MKSSLFLRTCQRDIHWAEWCLKSIGKHWKTKSEIVVSADPECEKAINECQEFVGPIKFCPQQQWEPGWNFQQYAKMTSDEVCLGELITFIDSDCVFTADCCIEDLLENDKPVIWYTEYARLSGPLWKGSVEKLMKTFAEYEFMRRFPITYWRNSLKPFRDHVQSLHGHQIQDLLKGLRSHVFSEFNMLGNYVFRSEFNRYAWRHTDEIDLHPEKYQWHVPVRQFNWFEWNENTPALLAETIGLSELCLK